MVLGHYESIPSDLRQRAVDVYTCISKVAEDANVDTSSVAEIGALCGVFLGYAKNAQSPVVSKSSGNLDALLPERQTFESNAPVLALLRSACKRVPIPNALGDSDLVCTGTVRNIGSEAIKSASVKMAYYRKDGSRESEDGVRIHTLPLPPGATSTFELNYYSADSSVSAAKWDIWFETFYDDPIPMRDDR
jgi:hypothetical protein